MDKRSYRIKHDFLFDSEDTEIVVPQFDSNLSEKGELRLSDTLKAKDEVSFNKLFDAHTSNIVIIDDIGKCKNPASERYKQFIVRCIYRKLAKYNISVHR